MSEIKGQLLGIILTIIVFGATSVVLAETFHNTNEEVVSQSSGETSQINDAINGTGALLNY